MNQAYYEERFLAAKTPDGLSEPQIEALLREALLCETKRPKRILLLPPDITRLNSYAGPIVGMVTRIFPDALIDMMPALGTHVPMTPAELDRMYPGFPHDRVYPHRWRDDVVTVGTVPGAYIREISDGLLSFPVEVQVNRRLLDPQYDLILSIGQVVPHEVAGMANFNKNVFVGCGGKTMIDASHFLGAVYGMERMMGRDGTPVHKLFDYAESHFVAQLPLVYILTTTTLPDARLRVHSVGVGRSRRVFKQSIDVSQKVNFTLVDEPLKKCVVFLDPDEFRTTWLGNKAIYRTRMAMADDGELIVLAPGVRGCGEDPNNDVLIRKYGYMGRDQVLRWAETEADMKVNLSVAAHLIHGSSDGRFKITYAPGGLTQEQTESIGFGWLDSEEALRRYPPAELKDGWNVRNGERFYYISNPALGLWASAGRFEQN